MFLSLLLLQAIPVLHFFAERKADFYSLIDEEKPSEKSEVEKKAGKEFTTGADESLSIQTALPFFNTFALHPYAAPLLEDLTPPPNA